MSKISQGAGVLTITQVKSAIGRKPGQKETLVGLGLNKLHKTSTLEDTPAIRGMVDKVSHLLKIEDNN
jgi:large subunit ribosomal protein L30